jgi:type IV pilus assembly protein PilQ
MKKYLISLAITTMIGSLIYLSSIYLARAEYSLKQLTQNTEELEKDIPSEKVQPVQSRVKPEAEIKPAAVETAKIIIKPSSDTSESIIQITPAEKTFPETAPSEPTGPPLISMDFVNANLKDVLKIFCQQSRLNFIAGENVELKPITLYLNNVSIDDALNSIINANGLRYERAPGSDIFIVRKNPEPEIKLETKIYKLNYAFAEDQTITGIDNQSHTVKGIKEIIQKLLTPNGDMTVDVRTNSLIITDIASRFPLIEQSIDNLDSQLAQVLIEAKVVELGTDDLSQLGIKWSSLGAYNFGYRSPVRTYNSERTSEHDRTNEITTDVTNTRTDELTYSVLAGTASDTTTIENETVTGSSLIETFNRNLAKSDIRSAILSADDFTLTLSLLLTNGKTDIISSPNIVTTNGKEAKITVGEKYPIPQYTYNTDTSTWEVQGFEYKDIGVLLRVIPYAVEEKSNVSLDIHPEVSTIAGYVNFGGGGGAKIPIIATREATTNVIINDGDTLAIGGLLTDSNDTTVVKVPVLGDIPVLGRLFTHKEETKTKNNLVIFITPHILQNGRVPPGAVSEANIQVPMGILVPPSTQVQQVAAPQMVQADTKKPDKPKTESYNFGHR